jgi:hypothetical protein
LERESIDGVTSKFSRYSQLSFSIHVFFLLGAGGNLTKLPAMIERQHRILRRARRRVRSSASLPEGSSQQGKT